MLERYNKSDVRRYKFHEYCSISILVALERCNNSDAGRYQFYEYCSISILRWFLIRSLMRIVPNILKQMHPMVVKAAACLRYIYAHLQHKHSMHLQNFFQLFTEQWHSLHVDFIFENLSRSA